MELGMIGVPAIVDAGDEVGNVVALVAVQGVRNREAQVVVLYVTNNFRHAFQHLRRLLFPRIGVGHNVRNVALEPVSFPCRAGGVEIDVARRSDRVVGTQNRQQRLLALGPLPRSNGRSGRQRHGRVPATVGVV